jgi:Post-segregation antitoxin CcdA
MRMNISVPDALAEEVRRRDLPISAICQRALRDEVTRARAIEKSGDIRIYIEADQPDSDPASWPGFDPGKPNLVYGRNSEHRMTGWTLWYERGAEAGDNPADYFIPGDRSDVEWALSRAREVLRLAAEDDQNEMEKITVEVGDPSVIVGFTGRWLVTPGPDETRTSEGGHDAGAYWGVALTERGRIAVYTAHCNEAWPANLSDYDTLDAAIDSGLPADIAAWAAAELGQDRVIWRNI